jgi:hypothetical protein
MRREYETHRIGFAISLSSLHLLIFADDDPGSFLNGQHEVLDGLDENKERQEREPDRNI